MANIIFIPFPEPEAEEFRLKAEQWNKKTGDKFTIVVYQPGKENPALKNLGPGDQIYVRGHGLAGSGTLATKNNGVETTITVQEGIDRLIDSGLDDKGFAGKIKFYNCYSGLHGPPRREKDWSGLTEEQKAKLTDKQRYDGYLDPRPTAEKGAEYLQSKGYKNARFFGYRGPLSSEYEDRGAGVHHKYVKQLVESVESLRPGASQGEVQKHTGLWVNNIRSGKRSIIKQILGMKGDMLHAKETRASQGRKQFGQSHSPRRHH